jgi:hypothetical protein
VGANEYDALDEVGVPHHRRRDEESADEGHAFDDRTPRY